MFRYILILSLAGCASSYRPDIHSLIPPGTVISTEDSKDLQTCKLICGSNGARGLDAVRDARGSYLYCVCNDRTFHLLEFHRGSR